ncbi:MAG: FlgD immunoglobulin-like domain containing protein [Candidatus Krumholzibacteriota bacterium]
MLQSPWKPGMVAVFVSVCLACLFLGGPEAEAAIGTSDSPLFSLNSQSVSGVENQAELPRYDRLGGSYPNPFNPLTRIRFELAQATAVDLRIYDMQGRLVRVLLAEKLVEPGVYEAEWDGRDGRGARVATGVYLYRLVTDNFSGSKRMTLVK